MIGGLPSGGLPSGNSPYVWKVNLVNYVMVVMSTTTKGFEGINTLIFFVHHT